MISKCQGIVLLPDFFIFFLQPNQEYVSQIAYSMNKKVPSVNDLVKKNDLPMTLTVAGVRHDPNMKYELQLSNPKRFY